MAEEPVRMVQGPSLPHEQPVKIVQGPSIPEQPIRITQGPSLPEIPVRIIQGPGLPNQPIRIVQGPSLPKDNPVRIVQGEIPVGNIIVNDKQVYSNGKSSIVWDYNNQIYALDYPYTPDKLRKVIFPPDDSINVETVENAYQLMGTFGIDQSALLGMGGTTFRSHTPSKSKTVNKSVRKSIKSNDTAKGIYI